MATLVDERTLSQMDEKRAKLDTAFRAFLFTISCRRASIQKMDIMYQLLMKDKNKDDYHR